MIRIVLPVVEYSRTVSHRCAVPDDDDGPSECSATGRKRGRKRRKYKGEEEGEEEGVSCER